MDHIFIWLDYCADHPVLATGIALAVLIAFFALNRKPKYVQEADAQLKLLRRDRADKYRDVRPLQ